MAYRYGIVLLLSGIAEKENLNKSFLSMILDYLFLSIKS